MRLTGERFLVVKNVARTFAEACPIIYSHEKQGRIMRHGIDGRWSGWFATARLHRDETRAVDSELTNRVCNDRTRASLRAEP
jgi:hypothetical protein